MLCEVGSFRHPRMMRLSTIDLISAVMDQPVRPLDFAIVLHLRDVLAPADLEAGARSAQRRFPSTAAVLAGREWRSVPEPIDALACRTLPITLVHQAVRAWIDEPSNLTTLVPVRQLFITCPGESGALLVTRFHHAAADGLAAMMWLREQLGVACGLRAPQSFLEPHSHPALRQQSVSRRTSMFSFGHPSDRLRHNGHPATPARRWHTIDVACGPLRAMALRAGGFTYNDLLATCALETFRIWNAQYSSGRAPEVGVWLPVNIRTSPLEGFGNGSSRIRVYNRYTATAPMHEKCRAVRLQVEWSRKHGEWVVPNLGPIPRLPIWVLRPLLRAYFNRPWVDMGTGVFTHMERSALDDLPAGVVSRVEIVGMLDTRHPFGICAASMGDTTHVTFVHDPAQLSDAEAHALAQLYQAQLALALTEGGA